MSPLSSTYMRYIGRKLIPYIITVFVAITANFFIPRLIPGDPITVMLSRMSLSGASTADGAEIVEAYKKQFGLDGSWLTQYKNYILNLFQGDLGPSIMAFPMTVHEILMTAIPWTIGLLVVATVISWVLGNLLGVLIGWRRESKTNSVILYLSLCLNQVPYYFIALILVFFLAYTLPIFPTTGAYSVIGTQYEGLRLVVDIVYHATLPALSIIISFIGYWIITMRSLIITTLGEDYILLAEAKGLKRSVILSKYAFRNALLPQTAALGMQLGFVLNGAILLEIIFNYPGIGALLFLAIGNVDYNLMQGILLLTVLSVLSANLILEMVYPLIDPRISHGGD
ncbi:MAG: ABC transporter permease [Euryarchaeota archaeon]|nr:ABC transporter permease [Euryarchaeota archaeon]MDC0246302.1 ABC transporter permease [Deltaproteobacteria bacterium]